MSWKSKPSWYFVATKHRTVQAWLQRFVAKRMGGTVFETDGSHVPMRSQADLVLAVIRKAANAVRQASKAADRTCFRETEGSLGAAKGEAPLQTSAEFVGTYGAFVNALTATVINAEAGLSWLSAQPPDLEAVRRTLNMIVKDSKRAGEIVVRLRAPLQRDDPLDP
ncbi:hypothetical protein ACE102_47115 (plasmid) [Bradyrhizobium sp. vgs-9]|uniref:hypothetical protein n=1 Tax=Bradyrhizobium sp. vgs-9 TaxID=208389 RepID=UPI0035D40F99